MPFAHGKPLKDLLTLQPGKTIAGYARVQMGARRSPQFFRILQEKFLRKKIPVPTDRKFLEVASLPASQQKRKKHVLQANRQLTKRHGADDVFEFEREDVAAIFLVDMAWTNHPGEIAAHQFKKIFHDIIICPMNAVGAGLETKFPPLISYTVAAPLIRLFVYDERDLPFSGMVSYGKSRRSSPEDR